MARASRSPGIIRCCRRVRARMVRSRRRVRDRDRRRAGERRGQRRRHSPEPRPRSFPRRHSPRRDRRRAAVGRWHSRRRLLGELGCSWDFGYHLPAISSGQKEPGFLPLGSSKPPLGTQAFQLNPALVALAYAATKGRRSPTTRLPSRHARSIRGRWDAGLRLRSARSSSATSSGLAPRSRARRRRSSAHTATARRITLRPPRRTPAMPARSPAARCSRITSACA